MLLLTEPQPTVRETLKVGFAQRKRERCGLFLLDNVLEHHILVYSTVLLWKKKQAVRGTHDTSEQLHLPVIILIVCHERQLSTTARMVHGEHALGPRRTLVVNRLFKATAKVTQSGLSLTLCLNTK